MAPAPDSPGVIERQLDLTWRLAELTLAGISVGWLNVELMKNVAEMHLTRGYFREGTR